MWSVLSEEDRDVRATAAARLLTPDGAFGGRGRPACSGGARRGDAAGANQHVARNRRPRDYRTERRLELAGLLAVCAIVLLLQWAAPDSSRLRAAARGRGCAGQHRGPW